MRYCLLISVFITGLLGGCGFELRGTGAPLSSRFEKTYLSHSLDRNDVLGKRVKDLIVLNGGKLVSREVASIVVNTSGVNILSRKIAASSNGALAEYERTYSVTVVLLDLESGKQLGSRVISTTRNMQLSDSDVLAGEEQSKTTQINAENALAQAVILYLKTF